MTLQNEYEEEVVITENLKNQGYRELKMKSAFLNIPHLELIIRKLGKFHSFSYQAKRVNPKLFESLVKNLKLGKWVNMEDYFAYQKLLDNYFLPFLVRDKRFKQKLEVIREVLREPNKLLETIYMPEENTSVLTIYSFHENCMLFKYNTLNTPIDMKFIFLRKSKYCAPFMDIGFVLYILANQNTRNTYWHHLLDVYYTSLRNTFPENRDVPKKNLILKDTKRRSLFMFI